MKNGLKYVIGIDPGTASVGVLALALDEQNNPTERILAKRLIIFDESVLPAIRGGVGALKNTERRDARSRRKQIERKARRPRHLVHRFKCLPGFDPTKVPADDGQTLYSLRAHAVRNKVSREDLLQVLLCIIKKRGYSGGFKATSSSAKHVVKPGIDKLRDEMAAHQYDTPGEYLVWHLQQRKHLRLKDDGLFVDRGMIKEEVQKILDTQAQYHPELTETFRDAVCDVLFGQRPLKSPASLVGRCGLEPNMPRAPLAHPDMQDFRIRQQLANLRWGHSVRTTDLSAEQYAVMFTELHRHAEVSFSALYKALDREGVPYPLGQRLNLSHGGRDTLKGDRTTAAMNTLGVGQDWAALSRLHQGSVINLLAEMESPEIFESATWPVRLRTSKDKPRTFAPEVIAFINTMVGTGKFGRLPAMGFEGGRAGYSVKALRKLVEIMKERGMDEHNAIQRAYAVRSDTPIRHRSSPDWLCRPPVIGNPLVDRALKQIWRAINYIIAELGCPPEYITIEFPRELRWGRKKRQEHTEQTRMREARHKEAEGKIRVYTEQAATRFQTDRFLAWKEQRDSCPYCGKRLLLSDVLNGNTTEFDHILPYSLTRQGKAGQYRVLACKRCNQDKKNKTPWEAWGQTAQWKVIERSAQQFKTGHQMCVGKKTWKFQNKEKAQQLLIKDFEHETLDDDVINDFINRQYQATAYVAKLCKRWLETLCPKVYVSNGRLTAKLRHRWGLETVIPQVRYEEGLPVYDDRYSANKKESTQQDYKIPQSEFNSTGSHRRVNKRIDHRQHVVDAFVIALTTPQLYRQIMAQYKHERDSGRECPRMFIPPLPKHFREQLVDIVRHTRPIHRPDHRLTGKLFKDNPSTVGEYKGQPVYVQRKPITDLKNKNVSNIYHGMTRTAFDGVDLKQDLQHPVFHPVYNTQIRKVRICGDTASDAVRVEHGTRTPGLFKYLEPEGYAYLEYDTKDPRVPWLIRRHEAMKRRASSTIVRIWKKDTVYDKKSNRYYVVQKFAAAEDGPKIFLSLVTEAIANIDLVNSPRRLTVSGDKIKKLQLERDVRTSNPVNRKSD